MNGKELKNYEGRKLKVDFDVKEKATLKGHSSGVTNINFSPNGQIIVSADSEKNIKI